MRAKNSCLPPHGRRCGWIYGNGARCAKWTSPPGKLCASHTGTMVHGPPSTGEWRGRPINYRPVTRWWKRGPAPAAPAGTRWCWKHRAFEDEANFSPKASMCRAAWREYQAERRALATNRAAEATVGEDAQRT
jgi:hypothetical protein